nr:MAG TPA: hypothetical protein [Caudoviricetes sp.]
MLHPYAQMLQHNVPTSNFSRHNQPSLWKSFQLKIILTLSCTVVNCVVNNNPHRKNLSESNFS